MSDLREAAQQALEALDIACRKYGDVGSADTDWGRWDGAMTALSAALAEPVQEPVQVQRNYLVIKNEFYGNPPAPHATWGAAMAAMLDAGVIKGLTISAREAK